VRNLLALLLFVPSFLFAQSRFDGTWKMKMGTLRFSGTVQYLGRAQFSPVPCNPAAPAQGSHGPSRSPRLSFVLRLTLIRSNAVA
jgi:hypothetical protein